MFKQHNCLKIPVTMKVISHLAIISRRLWLREIVAGKPRLTWYSGCLRLASLMASSGG